MVRQIYIMALAVPLLSLTPQAHAPSLHLCLPMLIPPCSELLWGERPGENWLKTKENNKINSFLLVYTAESVHCRASSEWEHQPGQDEHTQHRQSQISLGCVPELLSDSPAGQKLQPVPPALSFWDFNYSQSEGRKDQTHKQKALSCLHRQVGYFSQKPTPVRFSTCTALPWAEPHCSVGGQLSSTGQTEHASVAWRRDRDYR